MAKDTVLAAMLGGRNAILPSDEKLVPGTFLRAEFEPVELASTGGDVVITAETDAPPGSAVNVYVSGVHVDSFTVVEDNFSATYSFGSNSSGTVKAIPMQLKLGTLTALATVVIGA
jgi:hypothetical protein